VKNVFSRRALGRGTRVTLAGAVLYLWCAGPAWAQEIHSGRPLLGLENAIKNVRFEAAAEEGQAPAASSDPVLNFFRGTELSGFVDMYYTYNGNKPQRPCANVGGVAISNCLYNFNVAHNSFSLNLAEVALEKKPTADSRGGFRIDLDYGSATGIVHGFEPGGLGLYQNIQQAYVSYLAPAGTGLQLDFGKFVTPAGYEVIETKDNWNYSRSLLFALAIPYYHMGMRAIYSPSDKVTVAGYLVNGWNNVVDNNTGKTVGVSVTLKPTGAVSIIENYLGGPEQTNDNSDWRHLSDTVVTYTATPQLSLAANYDYGQEKVSGTTVKWQGVAGYLKYQANGWFALVPRAEYFDDTKGGFATAGSAFQTTGFASSAGKIKEFTLTAEFKHKDGVMMRLEYRGDFSDEPFFLKNFDEPVKNQNTFIVGIVYAFSSKAP
jgi:hypothetical protein